MESQLQLVLERMGHTIGAKTGPKRQHLSCLHLSIRIWEPQTTSVLCCPGKSVKGIQMEQQKKIQAWVRILTMPQPSMFGSPKIACVLRVEGVSLLFTLLSIANHRYLWVHVYNVHICIHVLVYCVLIDRYTPTVCGHLTNHTHVCLLNTLFYI